MKDEQGKHFCQCGCDEAITLRPEHFSAGIPTYRLGHMTRVTNPNPKKDRVQSPCECGCGRLANPGQRFVQYHHMPGIRRSEETRAKLREQKLGDKNPAFGKPAHNALPPVPVATCACGCKGLVSRGRRFVTGHNTRGTRLSNYRGWYRASGGYIKVEARDHPLIDIDGYVMEHRLAMEVHLRETEPESPFLVKLGRQLYLRPEIEVHHRDEVTDHNEIDNLQAMTAAEHRRHHKTKAT